MGLAEAEFIKATMARQRVLADRMFFMVVFEFYFL
jgi:hypothetical protein